MGLGLGVRHVKVVVGAHASWGDLCEDGGERGGENNPSKKNHTRIHNIDPGGKPSLKTPVDTCGGFGMRFEVDMGHVEITEGSTLVEWAEIVDRTHSVGNKFG